jgi:hypothetical protein
MRMWLQRTLLSERTDLCEDDIYALIVDPTHDDETLLIGIDFLRTFLSRKPLAALFTIASNGSRPEAVRVAAAEAISYICDQDTKRILREALAKDVFKE